VLSHLAEPAGKNDTGSLTSIPGLPRPRRPRGGQEKTPRRPRDRPWPPRIITHSWHFSQLAIAVHDRSTPVWRPDVRLLLRQGDLPGDRGNLLTFLTTLLRDIALSADTVSAGLTVRSSYAQTCPTAD